MTSSSPGAPDALDALARIGLGGHYSRRDHPLRDLYGIVTLGDDDQHGRHYQIPSPRRLAQTFLAPRLAETFDLRRRGRFEVLARPLGDPSAPFQPLDPQQLAAALANRLSTLPERPDGSSVYNDVRLFAEHAGAERFDRYVRLTVAALRHRDVIPTEYREPRSQTDRPPALTAAERKQAQRDRERDCEARSSAWWLEGLLAGDEDGEPPAPGTAWPAPQLFADASDVLAELAEDEEPLDDDDPEGPKFAAPRRRVFYAEADRLLDRRRPSGGAGAHLYAVRQPKENLVNNLASAVLDRAVDILAQEVADEIRGATLGDVRRLLEEGDRLGALRAQRDRLASTGTEGAPVIDLAARRAGRAGRDA